MMQPQLELKNSFAVLQTLESQVEAEEKMTQKPEIGSQKNKWDDHSVRAAKPLSRSTSSESLAKRSRKETQSRARSRSRSPTRSTTSPPPTSPPLYKWSPRNIVMWGLGGEIEAKVSENKSLPEALSGGDDTHKKELREASLSREGLMTDNSKESSVETHLVSQSLSSTPSTCMNITGNANANSGENGTLNSSQASQNILHPVQGEIINSAPMEMEKK